MSASINGSFVYAGGTIGWKFAPGLSRDDPALASALFRGADDIYAYQQPFTDPRQAHDVLWPRSDLFQAGGYGSAINAWDCMQQRWEWDWPATGVTSRKRLSGVTRDANGNVIGGVTVYLFNTATGLLVDTVVSDSAGNYYVSDPNAVACFAVGYLAGSPDTTGATRNDLTGT